MNIDPRRLQHTFSKHAPDFGIVGTWNLAKAALLEQAINNHVSNPAVQQIVGTYRWSISVRHYYDRAIALNVMVDMSNNFIGGWRLSPAQVLYLLTTGNIQ